MYVPEDSGFRHVTNFKRMKKGLNILLLAVLCLHTANAQKLLTKEGTIDIFSQTSLFTIEAKNQKVASILNMETGEVVASTLVRSFKFKEALVEEHFNENYMESHKFPKSVFKGKIVNFNSLDLSKNGTYLIDIEGSLTMHGETRTEKLSGKIFVENGKTRAVAETVVSLQNYKIEIEDSYKDRIKDAIKLIIEFDYLPM